MFSKDEIKKLVSQYFHTVLNRCEELRSLGIVHYESPRKDEATKKSSDDTFKLDLGACDELIELYKNKLFRNDFEGLEVRLDRFLKEKGINIDKESVEYTKLCREILKAEIEVFKVEKERITGNYNNNYDKLLDSLIEPTKPQYLQAAVEPPVKEGPIVTLSNIIEENIKEAELAGNWSAKTKAENESIYKVILEVLGDVDINSITHQTMLQFRDKVSKLPANREKKPQFRGKSVDLILEMKNVPPMSRTTLNKYLVRASTLFKWAVKHGYIKSNAAEGLSLPKTRRMELEREAYTSEDIQNIASHLTFDKLKAHMFWIPLIGIYTGMRLDEICQLYVSDIMVVDDVPCININSKDDKKLKTASSERIIPIHPNLIDFGFVQYVEQQRLLGNTRLWTMLKKKRDGYSQDFGKWFQRFNRKYVTVNPKKVFHSLRHSLANNLKQKGVQEAVIAEILGHSGDSMTMNRYGKRYQPKMLLEALMLLDYGIQFKSKVGS
jgi:integrase